MKTRIKVHETNGDHHGYIEWIVWKQSFMMNQQWLKGVLMITMITTKDDDKSDEQKAQVNQREEKGIGRGSREERSVDMI